jgi:uncharacterized protein (TIGR03437 family)
MVRTGSCLASLFLCLSAAFAQAPTGLTVKTATSKQVVLTWTGSASSYTVQRAPLGGAYSTVGSATSATYTDTTIDAFTTYQYQVLNGTAASAAVTVGPPPAGVTNVAPAPLVGSSPSNTYGYNIALTLDGNSDPAFLFLWDDPNANGHHELTQLLFRNWNRAKYAWNPVVKIATVGDVSTTFRSSTALGYDTSTGTFVAASEIQDGDSTDIVLYTSSDGAAWTLKNTFRSPDFGYFGPSVALRGGNLYLTFTDTLDTAVYYVTGQLSQPATFWTTKKNPQVSGFVLDQYVSPSLALDSNGAPGIAYSGIDDNSNGAVLFWRPVANTAVKAADSQGNGSVYNVKLLFYNTNPRITASMLRNDSNSGDTYGDSVHFMHSEDGGTTWAEPVIVPPDGNSSSDYPFDMGIDSKGMVGVGFGQNSNSGDSSHKCGNPKYSTSTDLTHFNTCSFAPLSVTQNFSVYPSSIQVMYGANDKLFYLWLEYSGDAAGSGVLMYREPPAGASAAPTITSVSDNNVTRASIVGGSWISIFGANLSGTTRIWADPDFTNGNKLPTTLDGVSVKVNGVPAAVYYISPTQVNVQAPNPISGSVAVQVSYNGAASNTINVNAVSNAPTLFSYSLGGTTFPSALFANSYIIVGDPALAGSIVAKPHSGDFIQLYVNGLGTSTAGTTLSDVVNFNGNVTVTIGGQNAPVQFAGLVAPGEFQINVQVPNLSPGLYPVIVTAAGQASQSGVMVPIQ